MRFLPEYAEVMGAPRCRAFLADVVALAEKHGGAGFLELMDNDLEDSGNTAAILRSNEATLA